MAYELVRPAPGGPGTGVQPAIAPEERWPLRPQGAQRSSGRSTSEISVFGASTQKLSVTSSRTSSQSVSASSTIADCVAAPAEDKERMTGVAERFDFLPGRAERKHDQRARVLFDREDVGERALTDLPPCPHPCPFLVGVGQGKATFA
jgi:hypothetical protein